VISKIFKELRFAAFVGFGKITAGYVTAKAKVEKFRFMDIDAGDQVAQAVPAGQLPEHHNQ
jgi:hypothetical protein